MPPKAKAKSLKAKAKAKPSKKSTKTPPEPVFPPETPETPVDVDQEQAPKQQKKFQEHPAAEEDLRTNWRTWSREHMEWREQNFDEHTMKTSMLRGLTPGQKQLIFAVLPPGALTVATIYDALAEEFGADMMLQERNDTLAYNNHARSNETLRDFMTKHSYLRATALGSGMNNDELTGGFSLLKAANLTMDLEGQILRSVKTRGEIARVALGIGGGGGGGGAVRPTYGEIAAEIRTLIQVHDLSDDAKSKTENKVLFGGENRKLIQKKKFKKKGGKGGGKGFVTVETLIAALNGANIQKPTEKKSDWICPSCSKVVFGSKTNCFSCNAAKPANPTLVDTRKGKDGGKGFNKGSKGGNGPTTTTPTTAGTKGAEQGAKGTCWAFAKGNCARGSACKFTHG